MGASCSSSVGSTQKLQRQASGEPWRGVSTGKRDSIASYEIVHGEPDECGRTERWRCKQCGHLNPGNLDGFGWSSCQACGTRPGDPECDDQPDVGESAPVMAGHQPSLPSQLTSCGTIVLLEHVNINVGAEWTPSLEILFFDVLGSIADPRAPEVHQRTTRAGGRQLDLRWANLGFQQFHLPVQPPDAFNGCPELTSWSNQQVIDGVIGIEWKAGECFDRLLAACERHCKSGGAIRAFERVDDTTVQFEACHGNTFRIMAVQPSSQEGGWEYIGPKSPLRCEDVNMPLPGGSPTSGVLGIRYVEYYVPWDAGQPNPLVAIVNTYVALFGDCCVNAYIANEQCAVDSEDMDRVEVDIGHPENLQMLRFSAKRDVSKCRPYDGHHIAIYVNNFVAAYHQAKSLNIVWENPCFPQFSYATESDAVFHNEFRFKDFVDPRQAGGTTVFELEHEVRTLSHPGFSVNNDIWFG